MEEEKAEEKSDFTQLSVLIAEDVKTMRTIFRKTLKSLNIGQVLHMAENGLEALKILNTVKIDLAIVDWKMPVMNGYELIEFIRNDRQHRDMPILMVTAESEKELVLEVAEIEGVTTQSQVRDGTKFVQVIPE